MERKFLEIGLGIGVATKKFEIVEVEKNTYMLKTIDLHYKISGWTDLCLEHKNSFPKISYNDISYSEMLSQRSSSMRQVPSEHYSPKCLADPDHNLDEMIKKADLEDILFIGGYRKLVQWSIRQKKVVKDHGSHMAGYILSMVQTSDKKYLFLSDVSGC
jgi:hypothetical protein